MQETKVYLVVDREYGGQLRSLATEHPVWIVHSQTNAPIIREIWNSRWPAFEGSDLTSFPDRAKASPADLASGWIGSLEEHHPNLKSVSIIGVSLDPALQLEFSASGYVRVEVESNRLTFDRFLKACNDPRDPTA